MFGLFKKKCVETEKPAQYFLTINILLNEEVEKNKPFKLLAKVVLPVNANTYILQEIGIFEYNDKILINEGGGTGYISIDNYSPYLFKLLISLINNRRNFKDIVETLLERNHYTKWQS